LHPSTDHSYVRQHRSHAFPGAVSGACGSADHSPWPTAFPPSPPHPPRRRACSRTSQVLCGRPTACARSSSAHVLRLPNAARLSSGRTQALPAPAQGASVHVRGLRPREACSVLAVLLGAAQCCLPALAHRRRSEVGHFAAQYPPYTSPCQRFAGAVTLSCA